MLQAALSLNLVGALALSLWLLLCFRIRDGHICVETNRVKWVGKLFPLIGTLLLGIGFILQLIVA